MQILQDLRRVNADSLSDVEDIVATLAIAETVRAKFEALGSLVSTPEWLNDKIKSLGRELKAKTADVLEKELREAEARRDGLRTPEEKRKMLDERIESLRKQRETIGV